MTEPKKPAHPAENGCPTCGSAIITNGRASDGAGGAIFAYVCSAEVVVSPGGAVRYVKSCPDFDKAGDRRLGER